MEDEFLVCLEAQSNDFESEVGKGYATGVAFEVWEGLR